MLVLTGLPAPARAQGLASSDLSRFRFVGGVQLSPDGHRAAYTVIMYNRPGRPYPLLSIMDLSTQKSVPVGDGKAPAAIRTGRLTVNGWPFREARAKSTACWSRAAMARISISSPQ